MNKETLYKRTLVLMANDMNLYENEQYAGKLISRYLKKAMEELENEEWLHQAAKQIIEESE